MEQVRIVVEELPELDTEVAIAGSAHLQEVGGAVCLAVLCGVVVGL